MSGLRKKPSFVLLAIILFVIPLSAVHAGLFSFLGEVFSGGTTLVFERKDLNSQNITLLQAAVNLDPNPSKGGGEITIISDSALLPEVGPLGTAVDTGDIINRNKDEISVYVVREGDSLSQIAVMFEVSTNTLIWANDLNRAGVIRPGQTLVILPVSGISHTIKKGETAKSITAKYSGDYKEVLLFNGLTLESIIIVGDTLIIPNGETFVPASTSRVASASLRGAGGPSYEGYYIWPVNGGRKTQGLHGYNGIDIGAPYGTPILAAASGEVIISKSGGWSGGYGTYIVIKHDNGTQTLYSHNSQNIVNRGWRVVQGQVIGYVGSTGRSTGPHTHFEVRGAKNPF